MTDEPQSVVVKLVSAGRKFPPTDVRAASLGDLRCVAHERVGISMQEVGVKFFEDSDGTAVEDDDYLLHLEPGSVVMVCRNGEEWQPEFKRADWCQSPQCEIVAESAVDGAAQHDSLGERSKEEQEKYSVLIQRLKSALRSTHQSEVDKPDGKQKADIPLDDIALLCEVDVQTLAQHMGMQTESAESLQQRLQVRLNELQQENDLEQLEELVKQLAEKQKNESNSGQSSTSSLSPEKRKPSESDSVPAKRTCSDDTDNSAPLS